MQDTTTLYIILVIFLATLVRSTFGFGEALVAVPLLALRIPVVVAAPLAVLMSVVVAGVIVVQDWRKIEVRSASWLILASLFGIPRGLLLVSRGNDHLVKLILGVVIAGFSIYSLAGRVKFHLGEDHLPGLLVAGFVAGLVGYAWVGLWGAAVTRYFLVSLPGVMVAIVIGRAINHRMRGDGFLRVVYVGLIAIGGILMGQAMG